MNKIINDLSVNINGDENNQPIIFVHGFPYDYSYWSNQIKVLEENYYCIAYDVRGLGKSYVGDGQYTMEAFVDDFYSIIYELNLVKPIICGHSMGGYIILRALEHARIKFGGLILTNTKSDADTEEGKIVRAGAINQVNVDGIEKFAKGFVPKCFAEESPKDLKKVYKTMKEIAKTSNPIGVKGCLIAMAMRTSTTQFLEKIDIPTLLLAGPFDNFMPPQILRDMSEKIKDSEFGIVPRTGHMSAIENPECVNDLLYGFLKRRISL